jgi:hypothetical protein
MGLGGSFTKKTNSAKRYLFFITLMLLSQLSALAP